MYKLLIADDEPWLRKRLKLTIDWESMGITELYDAEDGAEALKLAAQYEPDIIITDIDMPELSGIDLMKTLNESAMYPQIILISGYSEFEYARSAVKFGAVDYLLKPVDEEELKRIVNKCVATLDQNRYNKELIEQLSSSTHLLREKIYADILQGNMNYNKVPAVRLKELGVSFPSQGAICIIAHLHPASQTISESGIEETLADFSINNVINEMLTSRFDEVISFRLDDTNVFIVFSDHTPEVLTSGAQQVLAAAKEQISDLLSVRIAYGAGSVAKSLAELSASYREARYNINLCCSRSYVSTAAEDEKINDFQAVYEEYNIKSLIANVKNGDAAATTQLLAELIRDFINHSGGSPSSLQNKLLYLNVINSLFKSCLPFLPVSEDIIKLCVDYIEESAAFYTVEKMHAQLQSLTSLLLEQYQSYMGSKRHWLIDKIVAYINENYASALTMRDVASAFFLNPSYFCKLFKEETGVTFTNYLMKVRVENAKRFMAESSMKLYDVASAVGYTNVQYFSTVFKEIEGITPSQYRSGGV